MKTFTTLSLALAATAASTASAFILPTISRPSSSSRPLGGRPRPLASVQLPQEAVELLTLESSAADTAIPAPPSSSLLVEPTSTTLDQQQDLQPEQAPRKKAKGPAPVVVLEGDVLESTLEHRLLVGTHYLITLAALEQVAAGFYNQGHMSGMDWSMLVATSAFSLVFSDLFSGVFHWSVDNYGNGKTPLLGGVIEAFQGHHDAPWTITYREFCNNVHKITKITSPALLAVVMMHPESPLVTLFATIFFNLQVLSQEFHKYSHISKPPAWATFGQDIGLMLSRKSHGHHHTHPFKGNYCIVNGMCNDMLDNSNFFRKLEKIVYETTGAVPNCWKMGPEVRELALFGNVAEKK